jgi:hypothetical protein
MDRRTLQGIEACRPDSDDLLSAELGDVARRVRDDPQARATYDRVQAWDAAIRSAMDRVSVPQGLADRILDRLRAAEPAVKAPRDVDTKSAQLEVQTPIGAPSTSVRPASRVAWSRRRWLAVGSALAAALVVAVYVGEYLQRDDETPVEIMADAWLAELVPKWQEMAQAPREFEVAPAIIAEPTGWQRIGKLGAVRGVAYKLVHATAGTARLFVVRLSKVGLPTSPPNRPQWSTGGRSVGYWQSGELVYVLVVEGNENTYRAFVNSARPAVA